MFTVLYIAIEGVSVRGRSVAGASRCDVGAPRLLCRLSKLHMQRLRAEDLCAQYAQGQRSFPSSNLRAVDLFEAVLPGIDLSESDLSAAHLPYANLSQGRLHGSQLVEAEMGDAQLWQTDLTQADLQRANLCRANLRFANLRGADLTGANLQGADLSNADLRDCIFCQADLSRANLKNANLRGADLSGTNLFRAIHAQTEQSRIDRATVFPDGHQRGRL